MSRSSRGAVPTITLALSVGLVAGLVLGCGPKSVAPRAHQTIRFERGATAEFQKRVHGCLGDIALAGSRGRDFLRKHASVPIAVREEVGLNWTERAPPGRPQRIHWDSHRGGEYADGGTKLPCAILLHELTHAYENYVGLYSGEFEAMHMENWFIWRWGAITGERYQQRFYDQFRELRMPRQILWPQLPAPPPRGPKRLPPSVSDWRPELHRRARDFRIEPLSGRGRGCAGRGPGRGRRGGAAAPCGR